MAPHEFTRCQFNFGWPLISLVGANSIVGGTQVVQLVSIEFWVTFSQFSLCPFRLLVSYFSTFHHQKDHHYDISIAEFGLQVKHTLNVLPMSMNGCSLSASSLKKSRNLKVSVYLREAQPFRGVFSIDF